MTRRNFMRWQKAWKMFRKEERGAFGVTACGWKRRQSWRRREDISPLKNAQKINEIGEELAEIYKVPHLTSDFKKKNGYKRSIELSHEHALYRQNYCGCVFSKKEAMDRERLVTENRVNSNNG